MPISQTIFEQLGDPKLGLPPSLPETGAAGASCLKCPGSPTGQPGRFDKIATLDRLPAGQPIGGGASA